VGLTDNLPLLFLDRRLKEAGNQGLGDFTANVIAEMPAYQRGWGVAGTKARNPRTFGELGSDRVYLVLHDIERDFND
jgi:hypothetical protein